MVGEGKRCEDIRTGLENVFLLLHLFCQPRPNRQENCPFIFLLYLMPDNFTLYTQDNFTCLRETPLAWGLNATFYTVKGQIILLCLAPDDFSHQREVLWVLITGSQVIRFFENYTLILLVKLLLSYTRCSCCILNFIKPKCNH